MEVEVYKPRKRKAKAPYVPSRKYETPAIPYGVSQPNRFWRIKKDLPKDVYWKKRYWRRRITGRGDYRWSSSHSTGANIGGYLGAKAGQFIGGAAQTALTALTGMGDYKVKRNVFLGNNLPQIVNGAGPGGTTIRFQEYLGDVITHSTPGEFKIDSYMINAANPVTFPWLSQIACNYEQYDVQGMLFSFTSMSADALNSVNTALGSVMMATQYDVLDDIFQSKTEMLNYEFATSCKPSESVLHMIECDPRQTSVNELYCLYNQEYPPNADPRLYNLGRFSIATTGFQGSAVNIGQLQVTYQVRLLKPKLFTSLGLTNPLFTYFAAGANFQGFDAEHPLGYQDSNESGMKMYANCDIDIQSEVPGGPVFLQLPRTNAVVGYFIEIWWYGQTKVDETRVPTTLLANCSPMSGSAWNAGTYTTSDRMSLSFYIKSDGNGRRPKVNFNHDGVFPTNNQAMRINVVGATVAADPLLKTINYVPS